MTTPGDRCAADVPRPLVVRTDALEWAASPSPQVWRKRLEHSGPVEAGRVTSIVRYEPGSTFAAHPHPDGEEILVLEGTFGDEHGSYPKGTFVLNPEGFEHAPRSREGCILFVKLRQSPGRRKAVRIDTNAARFEPSGPGGPAGVSRLELYSEPGFPERIELLRLAPGAVLGPSALPAGAELLVLEGECQAFGERCGARTWLRIFPLGILGVSSDIGCTLYIKQGRSAESTPH